ncbi:unnamed protein product, partial [Brassica rapa subsp. trilocularis]
IVCLFGFEQLGWSGGSSLPLCYNFFFFWLMEIAKYTTPTEQQWP